MKLSDFIVVLPRMVGKCSKFRRDLLSYCSIVLFSPSRCCRCRGFLKNARFSFSSPIVYKSIIKIDIILRQHRSLLSLERQNAQFRWINRIIKLSKKNRKCLKAKLRWSDPSWHLDSKQFFFLCYCEFNSGKDSTKVNKN